VDKLLPLYFIKEQTLFFQLTNDLQARKKGEEENYMTL